MNKIYDVNYFIAKFEAIPEEKWTTGNKGIRNDTEKCALGHCNVKEYSNPTPESKALVDIFNNYLGTNSHDGDVVFWLNDDSNDNYQQPTPKQRILAALYDIKAKIQPELPKQEETPSIAC